MNTAILLATYNSERYLVEQIDSILNQTYTDWVLFIRDDGSTDRTIEIIGDYLSKNPEYIKLIVDDKRDLRSYHNFMEMLRVVNADYYFFCDHDDVWMPDKIEKCLHEMKTIEAEYPQAPIVIHSDMKVVDQDLNVISDSFWHYSRLLPECCSFKELVCCNCVNGCTMLLNERAKEVSIPNIDYGAMHDSLVAQSVAASQGVIYAIKEPLVLYRQHIDNVVGAANVSKSYFEGRLRTFVSTIRINYRIWKRIRHIKRLSLLDFMLHNIIINYKRFRMK